MTTTTISHLPTTHSFRFADAGRYLGQPILLLGVVGACATSIAGGFSLPLASLAILLGALAYLLAMERAIPFRDEWRPDAQEWLRDTIYFGINGALSVVPPALLGVLAILVAPGTTGLALGAEAPLAFLIVSLMGYWSHRLGHDIGGLWRLHGVHHTPDKVNTWNNNVVHFLDLHFQNVAMLAPLLILGFSAEAIFIATTLSQVMGFVDHVNADFRLGWLNYVIGSPEQHRLHHSVDMHEAGHYSVLPLWDLLFGSFTWQPGRAPAAIGIERPETFPTPRSIGENAMHPFRVWFRRS